MKITRKVTHWLRWHKRTEYRYQPDECKEYEIWLIRRTDYCFGWFRFWRSEEYKAYLPVWSWASSASSNVEEHFYSKRGCEQRVAYNWDTGEVSPYKEAEYAT